MATKLDHRSAHQTVGRGARKGSCVVWLFLEESRATLARASAHRPEDGLAARLLPDSAEILAEKGSIWPRQTKGVARKTPQRCSMSTHDRGRFGVKYI